MSNETNYVTHYINELKPDSPSGPLPTVTPCPYCGTNMSQAAHANHRPICAQDHQMAPPQSARLDDDAGGGYNANGTFPQK